MNYLPILDVREALQDPASNFADPVLQRGKVTLGADQLPHLNNGAFACVAQVQTEEGLVAVRIYLRPGKGRDARYKGLEKHIRQRLLELRRAGELDPEAEELFVPCTYHEKGIWVNGAWHAIAVMPWVKGITLGTYVEAAVRRGDTGALRQMADRWARLHNQIMEMQVSHGDLQHGNVMVETTASGILLRLIDYDGIWVPGNDGGDLIERGLPAYSHPNRTRDDWGPDIDRFSWTVIYLSLRALALDPRIRARHGREESPDLLFMEDDLIDPDASPLFRELRAWADGEEGISTLAESISAESIPTAVDPFRLSEVSSISKRAFLRAALSLIPVVAGGVVGIRVQIPTLPLNEVGTPSQFLLGLMLWMLLATVFFWRREQARQRQSAVLVVAPGGTTVAGPVATWPEVWNHLSPEQRMMSRQVGNRARHLQTWCSQETALPAPPLTLM